MSSCVTPEAPKRSPLSRARQCDMETKRRKLQFTSPSASSTYNSSSIHHADLSDGSFFSKNFITIRKLGEGDFGEVKEVQSRFTSDKFAIKISKVDTIKVKTGLRYTKMNLHEVRIHSSIPAHPNVLNFYQAWKEAGHVYMQLELCDDSLDGFWRKEKKLTESDINAVLRDMLLALNHLSSHNIVHLDVKPANILRTAGGLYKLADFSVSADLRKVDSSDEFGDGRFAAPELLSTQFTPKADLFSLAISLSQVSVSTDAQLTAQEWSAMKNEGILPARVGHVLSGSLSTTLQSMLLPHSSRPSAEQLLIGMHTDSFFDVANLENKLLRASMRRDRLSLTSSCERAIRENKSPLINASQHSTVIFHTDASFYEMERPLKPVRASIGARRPLRINLDEWID